MSDPKQPTPAPDEDVGLGDEVLPDGTPVVVTEDAEDADDAEPGA